MTGMAEWKSRIKDLIKKINDDKYGQEGDFLEDLESLMEEVRESIDKEDE